MCDFCLALVLALPRPARIVNLSRETAVAFARSYVPGVETAIAFAGEKWAFLVRILFAVVLSVSTVAVQRRAVVMGVSCWPASVAAEVSLVSKSPRAGSCARKSSPSLAQVGRAFSSVHEAPAPASCGGGRYRKECMGCQQSEQHVER